MTRRLATLAALALAATPAAARPATVPISYAVPAPSVPAAPTRTAPAPTEPAPPASDAVPPAPAVALDPATAPRPAPEPARRGTPYFDTPQQAMRYLATAYNRNDLRALAKVTTPEARQDLLAMRDIAPRLQLKRCTRLDSGAYDCTFLHTYPNRRGLGHAEFRVAPAIRHGWYMTVLESCG